MNKQWKPAFDSNPWGDIGFGLVSGILLLWLLSLSFVGIPIHSFVFIIVAALVYYVAFRLRRRWQGHPKTQRAQNAATQFLMALASLVPLFIGTHYFTGASFFFASAVFAMLLRDAFLGFLLSLLLLFLKDIVKQLRK